MIKKILIWIVGFFVIAFIALWVLGGGWNKVVVATTHYRNPFKYHSLIDYFFQITNVAGESFKLPGTPSDFTHLEIGTSSDNSYTSHSPDSVDTQSYTESDSSLTPQQKIDVLRARYEQLKREAAQQNNPAY